MTRKKTEIRQKSRLVEGLWKNKETDRDITRTEGARERHIEIETKSFELKN